MKRLALHLSLVLASLLSACDSDPAPNDLAVGDLAVDDLGCSAANCVGAGMACYEGRCVADCRRSGATACADGNVCNYTDGECRTPGACVLEGPFVRCSSGSDDAGTSSFQCGPGSACNNGQCVAWTAGCTDVECDSDGRCWGTNCPCTRASGCTTASLTQLNGATFADGAFDLDFDDECNAYMVTLISGPDYLRQLAPDGTLTVWNGTTNLNMGEVKVKRLLSGEFATIGDIAATYICCSTCGCVYDGVDNREGVVHLDRTSSTRPLPNVIPAQSTDGTGPFTQTVADTGPFGLVWGTDGSLYVGNVATNGDLARLDLSTNTTTTIAHLPDRIIASAVFDPQHLLIAAQNKNVYLLDVFDGSFSVFVTLSGEATSLRRDRYTGNVYAEINTTPPDIVTIDAAGATIADFQAPAALGRLTIAPNGQLYHLSVHPGSNTTSGSDVASWPLPSNR